MIFLYLLKISLSTYSSPNTIVYIGLERKPLEYIHGTFIKHVLAKTEGRLKACKDKCRNGLSNEVLNISSSQSLLVELNRLLSYLLDDSDYSDFENVIVSKLYNPLKIKLYDFIVKKINEENRINDEGYVLLIIELIELVIINEFETYKNKMHKHDHLYTVFKKMQDQKIKISVENAQEAFNINNKTHNDGINQILPANTKIHELSLMTFYNEKQFTDELFTIISLYKKKKKSAKIFFYFDFNVDMIIFEYIISLITKQKGQFSIDEFFIMVEGKIQSILLRRNVVQTKRRIQRIVRDERHLCFFICKRSFYYLESYWPFICTHLINIQDKVFKSLSYIEIEDIVENLGFAINKYINDIVLNVNALSKNIYMVTRDSGDEGDCSLKVIVNKEEECS